MAPNPQTVVAAPVDISPVGSEVICPKTAIAGDGIVCRILTRDSDRELIGSADSGCICYRYSSEGGQVGCLTNLISCNRKVPNPYVVYGCGSIAYPGEIPDCRWSHYSRYGRYCGNICWECDCIAELRHVNYNCCCWVSDFLQIVRP
jgi:hypothetical protein